jgi:hypothetical protein
MWYPIDTSDLPRAPAEGADNVPITINPGEAPPVSALSDWIQTEKDLDLSHTLSLGFAPFSLDESGDHRTIVLDAMRYADTDNIRWGVGVRCVLHAWSESGTVKGSVALVAAQVSLNLAYTRTTLQVMGYRNAALAKSFPGFEEMSVSNYSDLMKALDNCRDAILGATDDELTPTPVAISLPASAPKKRSWFHIHHN